MHPHLETLLEIQDLKTQRRELEATGGDREVQESVFGLGIDNALSQIDEKVAEMEASLPPQVRGRLQRMQAKHPRVVVPVIRGTCYGCFVQVPTALASDADRNEEVRTCQSCGRFLYLID
ncbi:C4-type zinc ribbon domain-containing protein [Longimicrobium sp.]|uniref:C4-type zinc ribbon domain-containing protein n=1 Tax=Longimicrobium sp. TaxID=2029185 RepID=UPI003B3B9F8E